MANRSFFFFLTESADHMLGCKKREKFFFNYNTGDNAVVAMIIDGTLWTIHDFFETSVGYWKNTGKESSGTAHSFVFRSLKGPFLEYIISIVKKYLIRAGK